MKPTALFIISFFLYTLSIVCYLIGISTPIFTTAKLYFFKDEIDLFGSIVFFYKQREWFVGTLILVFTFIFPTLKYIVLGASFFIKFNSVQKLLDVISKWSMLDVYIVAILIVNFKMDSKIISMRIESGLFFFSASVLLSMLVASLVKKLRSTSE